MQQAENRKSLESVTELEVRYAETDKMGVVYHANYLVWLEIARTKFLERLGFPYIEFEKQGFISPVLSCDLHYGRSCTYGDTVQIHTRVTKVTPVRTEYRYRLYVKGDDVETGKPRFTATTEHCLVRADDFTPVNQKKLFPALYDAYQHAMSDSWDK